MEELDKELQRYINSIQHYPQLTPKELKELKQKIINGDKKEQEKSRQRLVEGSLKLVIRIAQKYLNRHHGYLTFVDLIQAGNLGLTKASQKFDASHKSNSQFSTYAWMRIEREIQVAISKSNLIKLPESYIDTRRQLFKPENQNLSDEELCKKLKVSHKRLGYARKTCKTVMLPIVTGKQVVL